MSTDTQTTRLTAQGLPERRLNLLRPLAAAYLNRRWDVHERGQGKVPENGPVILASNHIGWLDGPLMIIKAPRPAHALVKHEMFTGKTGALLRNVGQIPVKRNAVDAGAARTALRALQAGQVVVVYPEGVRGNGEFDRIKGGAAWLALRTGAPIVPVAVFGTRQPGEPADAKPAKGTRLDIVYGDPMQYDSLAWPRDKASLDEVTEDIRDHLRAHVQWAQQALKRGLPGPLPKGTTDG